MLLCSFFFFANAQAQTLDQQQTTSVDYTGYSSFLFGQTFTAGLTGSLSKIILQLSTSGAGGTTTMNLYTTDSSGIPVTTTVLASATATVSGNIATDYTFTFASPYSVTAGTKYAFMLATADISSVAYANNVSSYANGSAIEPDSHYSDGLPPPYFFYEVDYDLYFKTYVTTTLATPSVVATAKNQLYPNPTTGIVTIKSTQNIGQVQVYSLEGKLLKTQTANANEVQVDITALPKGVYMLNTTAEGNATATQKIIKE